MRKTNKACAKDNKSRKIDRVSFENTLDRLAPRQRGQTQTQNKEWRMEGQGPLEKRDAKVNKERQ